MANKNVSRIPSKKYKPTRMSMKVLKSNEYVNNAQSIKTYNLRCYNYSKKH